MASIYAWTGALYKRGEMDGNSELYEFAEKLEKACIKTLDDGIMTKDLTLLCNNPNAVKVDTETFMDEIVKRI